jgi:hypothetical protein
LFHPWAPSVKSLDYLGAFFSYQIICTSRSIQTLKRLFLNQN